MNSAELTNYLKATTNSTTITTTTTTTIFTITILKPKICASLPRKAICKTMLRKCGKSSKHINAKIGVEM